MRSHKTLQNKSMKRNHISNWPLASSTTVMNMDENRVWKEIDALQEPENKSKKKMKISNSSLASSSIVTVVDENRVSEREDETPQETANKLKRKKKISNSSPASSTTMQAPLLDAMQESCEKCLSTSGDTHT